MISQNDEGRRSARVSSGCFVEGSPFSAWRDPGRSRAARSLSYLAAALPGSFSLIRADLPERLRR